MPGIEVHSVSPPRIEWTEIWYKVDMLNVECKPNAFDACLEMVLRKQLLFFKSFLFQKFSQDIDKNNLLFLQDKLN